ncbi:TetR/AcrR family transcriptional regulator [Phytoactinopolyspora alkaliphila]|uniref:TetR/AcrR family transcriptional regulator n=1 Tax=Phytoactinopolyspora alkaliphila TaxID=1783498 RepID=A0A6N9YQD9_9ACTN|nr:TetR/AcrR family transcriptional regulator [Phytoactinopolyspora alkaliphila]NED97058.1 TetR/AcrR family transcriptional regulator [Phytoactinopolyspora alkaliphila]
MDRRPSTSAPRARQSRAERKQETREALLVAAIATFARDGYHGASLEGIANEAGFSKGAVYSNFDGKAELFLAVMDYNLQILRGEDWDPFAAPETSETCTPDSGATRNDDAAHMVRGFGLATLEFIATAARDDTLIQELRERVQVLLNAYARVAEASRPAGETLPPDDVARLMAALDQGTSILALSGVVSMDGTLLRTGLRRLLDPANAAEESSSAHSGGASSLPDVDRVRGLLHDTFEVSG